MINPHPVRGRALWHYQRGRRIVRDALFKAIAEHISTSPMKSVDRAALAAQIVGYLIGEDSTSEVRRPSRWPAMRHDDLVDQVAHDLMTENRWIREAVVATLQLREALRNPLDPVHNPLQIRIEKRRAQDLLFTYATGPAGPPAPDEYLELAREFAALRIAVVRRDYLAEVATA